MFWNKKKKKSEETVIWVEKDQPPREVKKSWAEELINRESVRVKEYYSQRAVYEGNDELLNKIKEMAKMFFGQEKFEVIVMNKGRDSYHIAECFGAIITAETRSQEYPILILALMERNKLEYNKKINELKSDIMKLAELPTVD